MNRLLALPILLAVAGVAHADPTYDALTKPKATWTYDVIDARKHKPTGAKLTVTVASVDTVGAYTVVQLATTVNPAGATEYQVPPMIIGADGLRSPMGLDAADLTADKIADAYQNAWLPAIFLPGKLAKGSKKLHLDRFGQDDRDYKVSWTLAQDKKTKAWHLAWSGKFNVPEDPSGAWDKYKASTDFDPAIGFTQICIEDGTCFKLAK